MKSNTKLISNETIRNTEETYNPFQVYRNAYECTPNDTTDLAIVGVPYVSVGGTLKVDLFGNGTITYTVESGEFLPILVERVYDTGTTATVVIHY